MTEATNSTAAKDRTGDLSEKIQKLRERLRELGSVLVCYSGGLDSAFLLVIARDVLGDGVVAMTAIGPALAPSDLEDARAFAEQLGVRHELVDAKEMNDPNYVANGPDRCLHCKRALYHVGRQRLSELGLQYIANGTNLDDRGDYRPGLEAAREAGVVSPLVDAQFRKADVREAARLLGLSLWDKPAAACLASRIPYGTSVTTERLEQVAGYEQALRDLGLRHVRVRHHEQLARIEVDVQDLPRVVSGPQREAIIEAGKRSGYTYITVDLGGYRVGSHNEVLSEKHLRVLG